MKTKLCICYKCVRDLCPAPVCSLVGGTISVRPHGPRLVDSVGFLVVSLPAPPGSFVSLALPQVFLGSARGLPVGLCICHRLLLGEASQETVMLGSCLQAEQSIINSVRAWLSHMGWVSSWGSHWLADSSVCDSSLFPKHLVGKTTFG